MHDLAGLLARAGQRNRRVGADRHAPGAAQKSVRLDSVRGAGRLGLRQASGKKAYLKITVSAAFRRPPRAAVIGEANEQLAAGRRLFSIPARRGGVQTAKAG
ncbi:MAG: hypothetical protein F9K38_13155 [Pseudorhodoplanes sp.]|nr:MAG: hypothetical protein F9K38_13155 [Pseudorhodoplanes sp.]